MIEPIRISEEPAMTFAGLEQYFKYSETDQIPGLWQKFVPHLGNVPGQIGDIAWGLAPIPDRSSPPGGFDYLACVQVASGESLSDEFTVVSVAAQKYALFAHTGHVSELSKTGGQIWQEWFPTSGHKHTEPPIMLERYGQGFDPQTGTGDIEVWVSIQ